MTKPVTHTVTAGANIAFIKYWGNTRTPQNLPLNPSISMTLAACVATTSATPLPGAEEDDIQLQGTEPTQKARQRVVDFLDGIRTRTGRDEPLRIRSENSFPTGCGIASSAAGFAALAVVAAKAYSLDVDAHELSRIARRGSGSASRSIEGGFVELHQGVDDEAAFSEQLAPETHWPEIRDLVAVVSGGHKAITSAEGHHLAHSSEMLDGRLQAISRRADQVRSAIKARDLEALGEASEADALSMHAVMMTSQPPLLYWSAETISAIQCVWDLRRDGVAAWFTIDAGPNVHILTTATDLPKVEARIEEQYGWRTITDQPGMGAQFVEHEVT
jgi:diphosphomevalonate decarboxylase